MKHLDSYEDYPTGLATARSRGEIAGGQGLLASENPYGRVEYAQAWEEGRCRAARRGGR